MSFAFLVCFGFFLKDYFSRRGGRFFSALCLLHVLWSYGSSSYLKSCAVLKYHCSFLNDGELCVLAGLLRFLHGNAFSCSVIVCMAAVVIDRSKAKAPVGKMINKKTPTKLQRR